MVRLKGGRTSWPKDEHVPSKRRGEKSLQELEGEIEGEAEGSGGKKNRKQIGVSSSLRQVILEKDKEIGEKNDTLKDLLA